MSTSEGLDILLQTVANTTLRNPVEPYFASAWNYMTDNYSRFTIAMWISVVLHEVYEDIYSDVFIIIYAAFPGYILWSVSPRIFSPIFTIHAKI